MRKLSSILSRLIPGLLLLAGMALPGGCISDGGTEIPNGITGQLVDGQGKPVAGAQVVLYAVDYVPSAAAAKTSLASAQTDANGQYALNVPQPGSYNIEGTKGQTGVYIDSVGVTKAGVTVPRDTLKPLGAIRGITLMAGQSSLNQVRVTLYMPGTRQITKPAPGGAFSFTGLPAGRYQIVLDPTLDYYDVRILNVTVVAGDTLNLDTVRVPIHQSDTVMVGSGPVSGTWGPAKTYVIQGSAYVPEASTLNLLPGTRVVIGANRQFVVEGGLYSQGSPESLVTFSSGSAFGWQGVLMASTSFGVITRTVFEGATNSSLQIASKSVRLSNNVFRYSKAGLAIALAPGDTINVSNSIFHDITERAVILTQGRSTFRNNIFLRNLNAFNRYYCQTSSPPAVLSETSVSHGIFFGNDRSFTVQNCESPNYGTDFYLIPSDTLEVDPRFVRTDRGSEDYHLSPGSPARGHGVGGTDMGIYSTYDPR